MTRITPRPVLAAVAVAGLFATAHPAAARDPAAAVAAARERIAVGVANPPGFGRLTFGLPVETEYRVEPLREGGTVLRFPQPDALDLGEAVRRPPRNLRAVAALADGGLRIAVQPDPRIRRGARLPVDVLDAPPPPPQGAAAAPAPRDDAVETRAAARPGPAVAPSAAEGGGDGGIPAAASSLPPQAAGSPLPADDVREGRPLRLAQAQLPPLPAAPRPVFGPGVASAATPQPATGGAGAAPASTSTTQAPPQGGVAPRPPALAQAGGLPTMVRPPSPAAQAPRPPMPLTIEAGSGRLVQLPAPAMTVMAADPRVLRVQPASPTGLFIMGIAGGRTNVIATADDGSLVAEYDVTVTPGRAAAAPGPVPSLPITAPPRGAGAPLNAAAVESLIRRLVRGGEGVRVAVAGPGMLVLSGLVPSAAEAQRAEAIAKAYAGEDRQVVNSIGLLSGIQVNLRVRVAEISRQVTRELGFNWQALANDGMSALIGLRTGAAGSVFNAITGRSTSTETAPGRYGVAINSSRFDINAVVDALAGDQLITILAEPNLTAQSGEVASFLAGGEFPVPVGASPLTGALTIEFKQFGVSLAFVPTVMSPERLNLRVRPEVSELSENGAISLPLAGGVVRIPALSVRRAETTVELGSGQSFAIAGLLQRNTFMVNQGLIGLGDVPVLGPLFRSDRFRRNETELVIIITPYLVRPVSDPRAFAAPTDGFRPATDLDRIFYRRQIARGAPGAPPRTPADAGFIVE